MKQVDSEGSSLDRWRFGPYELDARRVVLWKAGEVVPIQKLPGRVLAHLIRADGEVVSRTDLLETFWGGRRIGFDDRLNTCISEIRGALGDSAARSEYVETVRGRGYRFRSHAERCSRARSVPVRAQTPSTARSWRRPFAGPRAPHRWLLAAAVILASSLAAARATRVGHADRPFREAWTESDDEEARSAYLRAVGLVTTGRIADLREARVLLDRSVREDPGFAAAHSALAVVSAALVVEASEPWYLDTARSALAAASRLRPSAPHVERARRAIGNVPNYGIADGAPDRSSARPPPADPVSRLAGVLELRGSAPGESSLRELEDWILASPSDARSWAELATELGRRRRFDEADAAYQVAIGLVPERPELYLRRARLLLRLGGTPDRAIRVMRSGEPHTGVPAEYLVHMDPLLARELAPHLDWRSADGARFERRYDRGVFYVARGLIESEAGAPERALTAFRRAVEELEPLTREDSAWMGTPDYFPFLGMAYAGLGMRREARAIADEVMRRFSTGPERPVAAYLRGLAAEVLALLG